MTIGPSRTARPKRPEDVRNRPAVLARIFDDHKELMSALAKNDRRFVSRAVTDLEMGRWCEDGEIPLVHVDDTEEETLP